jgi:hypothetical protein
MPIATLGDVTFRRFGLVSAMGTALALGCATTPSAPTTLYRGSAVNRTRGGEAHALASNPLRPNVIRPNAPPPPVPVVRGEDSIHAYADHIITERASAAARTTENVQGRGHLSISTDHGIVTVRGNVATERDRALIDAAIQRVPGVTRIEDQVRVEE